MRSLNKLKTILLKDIANFRKKLAKMRECNYRNFVISAALTVIQYALNNEKNPVVLENLNEYWKKWEKEE